MTKINLSAIETVPPKSLDKEKTKLENAEIILKIQELQKKLYAAADKSLLIVFQGLDASGKDGVVKNIFCGVNPSGVGVTSFRVPTKEQLAHDFLWRVHKHSPEKGQIQIFNRSHYEDVLVPTVEKLVSKAEIKRRYKHINNFEELLQDTGTTVLKFYLHISKEKQLEKLDERLTNPLKHWKHNTSDRDTREKFDKYIATYEDVFKACKSPEWHIISADKNWYKVNQVAKVILKALENMKLKWPELDEDERSLELQTQAQERTQEREEKKRLKKLEKEK